MIRHITETTKRRDTRLVMWWEDPAAIKYWEDFKKWQVTAAALDQVTVSLRQKEYKLNSVFLLVWVKCHFDKTVLTEEMCHLRDGYLPYEVQVDGNCMASGVDQLPQYMHAIAKAQEVAEWLESDPIIDGLCVSQHAWNEVASTMERDHKRSIRDATKKMNDPAFSGTEAAEFIDAMRTSAIVRGHARFDLVGRAGTWRESRSATVHAESARVQSTSFRATRTDRVIFMRAGKKLAKADLMRELQEEFSSELNKHWRRTLK